MEEIRSRKKNINRLEKKSIEINNRSDPNKERSRVKNGLVPYLLEENKPHLLHTYR